jgi:hypothetical protein
MGKVPQVISPRSCFKRKIVAGVLRRKGGDIQMSAGENTFVSKIPVTVVMRLKAPCRVNAMYTRFSFLMQFA